ncbi:hypothetical protein [Parvularcula sp. LCG005]|uniref:hypothetical protein n=1 Tax=Parvularcula sp. LCG005 TaxID=3078805 RepID=UPI002941FC08|nr:hypothetical protein [Parvularcula sp. LCG005]WOI53525.1 hypothetical protein RUI03_00690 [Parvularcula sp. LCG005]
MHIFKGKRVTLLMLSIGLASCGGESDPATPTTADDNRTERMMSAADQYQAYYLRDFGRDPLCPGGPDWQFTAETVVERFTDQPGTMSCPISSITEAAGELRISAANCSIEGQSVAGQEWRLDNTDTDRIEISMADRHETVLRCQG